MESDRTGQQASSDFCVCTCIHTPCIYTMYITPTPTPLHIKSLLKMKRSGWGFTALWLLHPDILSSGKFLARFFSLGYDI